jgi:hypothetical protein
MTLQGLARRPQAGRAGRKWVKGGVRIQRNRNLNSWPKAEEEFRIRLVRERSGWIAWMPPGSSQRNACTESFSISLQPNSVFRNKILLMAAIAPRIDLTRKCAKHILLGRLDHLKDDPTESHRHSPLLSIP